VNGFQFVQTGESNAGMLRRIADIPSCRLGQRGQIPKRRPTASRVSSRCDCA
jgi:hypothetical protein